MSRRERQQPTANTPLLPPSDPAAPGPMVVSVPAPAPAPALAASSAGCLTSLRARCPQIDMSQVGNITRGILQEIAIAANFAGLLTYILTVGVIPSTSTFINVHACPAPDSSGFSGLIKDYGKWFFMVMFVLHISVNKAVITLGKLDKATVQRVSGVRNLIMDGLETAAFTWAALAFLNVETIPRAMITSVSAWPLIAAALDFKKSQGFLRGTYEDYSKQIGPGIRTILCSLIEASYNGLSLSSASSFLIELIIDLFYNTEHSKDFPSKMLVEIYRVLLIVGLIYGVVSVIDPRARKALRFSEAMINLYYYLLMFSVSLFACLDPKAMGVDTFMSSGLYFVIAMALLALPVAVVAGWRNRESELLDFHGDVVPDADLTAGNPEWLFFKAMGRRADAAGHSIADACGKGGRAAANCAQDVSAGASRLAGGINALYHEHLRRANDSANRLSVQGPSDHNSLRTIGEP